MKTKRINFKVVFCALSALLLFLCTAAWCAPPGALPEPIQGIEIGDRFIPFQGREAGNITLLTGKGRVVVVHGEAGGAYYGKEGNLLYERDALYTLRDCRCRVEFTNKDVIIMAPETSLDIEEAYGSFFKGEKKSILSVTRGKAIFYALRLFRYKEMVFRVKTPTAAVGVRGTKFGAEIEEVTEKRSLLLDRMLASRDPMPVTAQASGGGGGVIARFYVLEGEVEVTSLVDGGTRRLRENEILEADRRGLGEIRLDPERTRAFVAGVVSGMAVDEDFRPPLQDQGFHRDQMERMDKLDEIRQQEMTPHIDQPSPGPGGGYHSQ